MAINFPNSLDSLSTKVDNVTAILAEHVNTLQDIVEALEAKVGITNSAIATSVDYLLRHLPPQETNWDIGSFQLRAETFYSDISTGTAPLTVLSTTKVTNLNVDRVDSAHVGTSGAAIPLLNAANTWSAIQAFGTYLPTATVNPTNDNDLARKAYVDTASGLKHCVTRGLELVYASTTSFIVNVGTYFHGNVGVEKTSNQTVTITSSGNWLDAPTNQYTSGGWAYVVVAVNGTAYLTQTAPNRSDIAGDTEGTLIYTYYGSTYYRCIGAIRLSGANLASLAVPAIYKWRQCKDWVTYDIDIDISTRANTVMSGSSSTFDTVDTTSYLPIACAENVQLYGDSQDAGTTDWYIKTYGNTYSQMHFIGESHATGSLNILTDSSGRLQYKIGASGGTLYLWVTGYQLKIR